MPITIEEAIARIPQWAEASAIGVALLPGGISNFNYRVDVDGESFVVRIAAQDTALFGINRQREYRCTVAASQTGVAPEVITFLPDVEVLVTRFISGRCPSTAEMTSPEMVARVVESMHRYHSGPAFEGRFSPFRALEQYLRIAFRYRAPLPPDVDRMHQRLPEIEAAVRGGAVIGPCHNDLWGPNLIDDGTRIR
ncbi:MAG TPA: choline/ethanolamine kinase family protein, partial [bacterium]|nr:choline/ethanolamine kinase family protein [bacterium]